MKRYNLQLATRVAVLGLIFNLYVGIWYPFALTFFVNYSLIIVTLLWGMRNVQEE